MAVADPSMQAYYAARAPYYDAVYEKPERRADIAFLRGFLASRFAHSTVLEGNTYEHRPLRDGSIHRVLKNFPSEAELAAMVSGIGAQARYQRLRRTSDSELGGAAGTCQLINE